MGSTSRSRRKDKGPGSKPKVKGLVSDRNRSSSSSSSDSDAGPGAKRERSLSVGSKEILAYRREQEMRQQRELDKLKGIKVEESEVKEVPKAEEDSDSETEWKKSKPLAEKLRTVIAPSISSEVTAAPSIVPAPTVGSEIVQKSVEPVPPPTLRKLKATVEKEEPGVSDLVKQERLQVKREVEELKKKVAEVKKRRSAESKDAEKKKERRESGEEEPLDEVERLRLQALKTLRSRTESGRSKSPSPGKKAALSEGLSDNVAVKKKSSKVSKELDEERKRVENQVKESLQKLNKTSEDTMELLTSLDKKKKKQKKEESDSESEESEKEKRKKKKSKKSKESDDSDSESEKKKKKKRSRADSDDDSDSEAERKKVMILTVIMLKRKRRRRNPKRTIVMIPTAMRIKRKRRKKPRSKRRCRRKRRRRKIAHQVTLTQVMTLTPTPPLTQTSTSKKPGRTSSQNGKRGLR